MLTNGNVRVTDGAPCYMPTADMIGMPAEADFLTSGDWFATFTHELTHWTSHSTRCNRELGKRFGDAKYAAEELVAELGAALVCSTFGVESSPQADHAQYVAHWLGALKADPSLLWTAGTAAEAAVKHLTGLVAPVVAEDAVEA